jgi:hypothetical protein
VQRSKHPWSPRISFLDPEVATMGKKIETMQQKSPAEFFAENKNIAGFDNVSNVPLHESDSLCKAAN